MKAGTLIAMLVIAWAFALVAPSARAGGAMLPLPEFKRWEGNMVKYGQKHFDERSGGFNERFVWYYDGQRVFYQIADYTKDKKWIEAAHNSREVYRKYVFNTNGRCDGWRIFPHGLAMDWRRNKNEKSKQAAIMLATKSVFAPIAGGKGEGLSRETAYIMNSYIAAKQLGEPLNPKVKQSITWALGHIDQWFIQSASDNWAPFMFGLNCEALINYYNNVEPDPRILPKIKMGLDECWKRAWVEKDQAFWYRARNKSKGAADLSLLVAPAYAWVYLKTGETKYRDMGDKLFAGGVRGAWLDGGKCFSQNYRWSFDYVKYRNEAELRRTGAWKEPGAATPAKPKSPKPARPAAKAHPLAPFAAELSKLREMVKAAEFAAALAECEKLVAASETKPGSDALATYRDCLAWATELKKLVVAEAPKKKPRVYIDFAGRPTRSRLVDADEEGGSFSSRGTSMPLKWRQISPRRFYGIARKLAPKTPAGHLMLGRYAVAAGLTEEARESLAKAAQDAKLREAAEQARALLR